MTYFLIAVYLFSAFLSWKYISLAYSSEGIWKHSSLGMFDIFMMFCPVANTHFIFIWLFSPPILGKSKIFNVDKFFNVKK